MVSELLTLLAVLTLGVLSPGPDFFVVLNNTVGRSRAPAFATVGGIAAGLAVQMTAISVGFSLLTPATVRVVQLAGAAFLVWMGVRTLVRARQTEETGAITGSHRRSPLRRSAFLEGLVCNLTNPKAFLFYGSMLGQVLPSGVPVWWRGLVPVLFVAHAALLWSAVVLGLQSAPVARRLAHAQRWLPGIFGGALLALAGWIAWDAW